MGTTRAKTENSSCRRFKIHTSSAVVDGSPTSERTEAIQNAFQCNTGNNDCYLVSTKSGRRLNAKKRRGHQNKYLQVVSTYRLSLSLKYEPPVVGNALPIIVFYQYFSELNVTVRRAPGRIADTIFNLSTFGVHTQIQYQCEKSCRRPSVPNSTFSNRHSRNSQLLCVYGTDDRYRLFIRDRTRLQWVPFPRT